MSDEADPLYRPLEGLDAWAHAPVDDTAWSGAIDWLQSIRDSHPDWAAMVDRG